MAFTRYDKEATLGAKMDKEGKTQEEHFSRRKLYEGNTMDRGSVQCSGQDGQVWLIGENNITVRKV